MKKYKRKMGNVRRSFAVLKKQRCSPAVVTLLGCVICATDAYCCLKPIKTTSVSHWVTSTKASPLTFTQKRSESRRHLLQPLKVI